MSNNSPKSIALRPSSSVKPVKEKIRLIIYSSFKFESSQKQIPTDMYQEQVGWGSWLCFSHSPFSDIRPHNCSISRMQLSLYLTISHQIEYFFCLLAMWLWRPLCSRLWLWPGRWLPVPSSMLLLELLQGGLLLPHHHRQAVLLPHHLVLLASGGKEDLARADGPGVHLTCEGGGALGGVAPWHLHHLRHPHRQHLPPLRHLHPFLFPTSTTPREVDSKKCSSQSSLGKTKPEWECDGWAGVKFTRQILQYIC